ncbi:hypothetical protein MMC25_007688 [Agyrium rufum]|nr:hypothetical protein [Agyrium rufum]
MPRVQHGEHIFVYSHLRTNQVVYSLTRSLQNAASLKQLPVLGKKTVPAALRKDLWMPFAHISFPHPQLGLSTYNKLREYRRLHETNYSLESVQTNKPSGPAPGQLLPKKRRRKVLMNQKANTVADIAAALFIAERPPSERLLARRERMEIDPTDAKRPIAKKGLHSISKPTEEERWNGGVEGVKIDWRDVRDAEWAEKWPEPVVHDEIDAHRYTIAWPPVKPVGKEQKVGETWDRYKEWKGNELNRIARVRIGEPRLGNGYKGLKRILRTGLQGEELIDELQTQKDEKLAVIERRRVAEEEREAIKEAKKQAIAERLQAEKEAKEAKKETKRRAHAERIQAREKNKEKVGWFS